ncbi:hypothetical protein J2Y48_004785 [Mycoplana sp. BE70]|uniref:hypothetical protein n=1 Tax=Mycoplana sp. BE70 TaxID=2817775 RepID=UPI002861A24D|nr:hypothetical protein [Mycoplana sp. BE70]MDR6759469.1 hypothetical protein [Mycoplana sp. BE70]
MFRIVLAACMILSAGQTFAATQYYVQHKAGGKCNISEHKPDGKAEMQVGQAFKTKADAEHAMKSAHECGS